MACGGSDHRVGLAVQDEGGHAEGGQCESAVIAGEDGRALPANAVGVDAVAVGDPAGQVA